ncbi:unnamed protein product [Arctia plantaginis]|uniref:Major facilitator superfamily (MFS) profile domain-containing protein n=1 Tax=Arctia plantaginis TaxID=874455 RepID=A0A8S1AF30_ARCPL|nr:unnamed protein product [Arctia plantaginis]CAB3243381.1 unnamed protein product [Arctia plantaginis]
MSKDMDKDSYPGFYTTTSMLQLGHGIWANLSTIAIGLAFGFPSIQTPQLSSDSSDIKVTTEEVSWLASILTLFSPLGCILTGILMDRYGRSVMLQCCTLPMFVGWIYTVSSETALHMIIARAVLGFGCGMAMGPSRIFTSEISLPNMRGLLGALPNMFMSFGMTVQAALSLFYSWPDLCYISGVFNMALFGSYIFLPETPYFLLLQDNTGKARKALAKVRDKHYDIDAEINDLIEFKQENNIP